MQGFTHSMFSWAMLVTTSHMVSFELRDPMIRVIALLPVVDIPRRHFNVRATSDTELRSSVC